MSSPLVALKSLESLKGEFDPSSANAKQASLQILKSAELKSAEQVLRLHETLCFMQAWPDDEPVLMLVDAMLARFDQRRDLRRHADELSNSGIAGTRINFRFYAGTARWLADRSVVVRDVRIDLVGIVRPRRGPSVIDHVRGIG